MHQNARLYNNSHLITPSRSESVRRDNGMGFGYKQKQYERRRKTTTPKRRNGNDARKQTTNMNQELKLNILKCGNRNTHIRLLLCNVHLWTCTLVMQGKYFGVASLHNRSHLFILFACHIPFILENLVWHRL